MLERRDTLPVVPTLPLRVTLDRAMDRLARRLVIEALGRWRHGHVTIELPGGEARALGDPAAPAGERRRVTVVDDAFFARLLAAGEVGAGEAYMDGLWRADDLAGLLRLFVRNLDAIGLDGPLARVGQLAALAAHRLRRNTRAGSARNIHRHYDLGNDFYRLWLDEAHLAYSCAIFERPDATLEEAQAAKLRRVATRLGLGPGDHVLEIGCGWGGFAIWAARETGCRVTAITVSREQLRLARERVREAGLEGRVQVAYRDYRDVEGRFDAIASIEMFEAVGPEYYEAFFARVARALRPGGRILLQTIAMPEQRWERYRRHVDWTQKHIFPGAVIPSLGAMVGALGRASDLVVEAVEDIGPHYAPTLREWRRRFFSRLEAVRALGFDERFIRTWEMYLCFSEASFAERTLQDLQLLLRRP